MDGNRRWVRQRGIFNKNSLEAGGTSLESAIACCLKNNIPYLSVYALSVENLKRADGTLRDLYALLNEKAQSMSESLVKKSVEMRFVGDRSLFDPCVQTSIDHIEQTTKGGSKLIVQALFCYGGQQEIAYATKAIAEKVATGQLDPKNIDTTTFQDHLWTAGIPAPDLIIRSGNMVRLSNFLLFQAAYSELKFLEVLWPDVTEEMLDEAIKGFEGVSRNFGV